MLIPMNDISKEGLDCNDQVVMGLAGILLTMTIEGILGRRNCLVIYSTLISMAAMFCDLLQRANVNVLTDIEKYENVNIIQHFIRFFADPVNSLVYLMTLSVYPYSLRYRVLRVSRLYQLRPISEREPSLSFGSSGRSPTFSARSCGTSCPSTPNTVSCQQC